MLVNQYNAMKITEVDKEVINNMIQINSDRIQGYNKAIDNLHPDDEDLKSVFAGMSRQSTKYKETLIQMRQELGEDQNETTNPGKVSSRAIKIKAEFSNNNRQTILNNCETGEDAVKKAYKMFLETKNLSIAVKSILESQQTELIAAHNHIKELRNSVA